MMLTPEQIAVLHKLRQQLTNQSEIIMLDELIAKLEVGTTRHHSQEILNSNVQLALVGDNNGSITINGLSLEHFVEALDAQLRPQITYEHWRTQQNEWLNNCFHNANEAHAHLGQLLNVAAESVRLIERANVWQQLDSWLEGWKDNRHLLAVLGEEGDGKTWSVAAWVHHRIEQQPQFPAVVFLSSTKIETNSVPDLLAHVIVQRSPTMLPMQAQFNTAQWLKTENRRMPLAILVLDGINERQSVEWWRTLLSSVQASPWAETIAVILTCRREYWQRHFASLSFLKVTTYVLAPYNDQELDAALAAYNLHRTDVPTPLLPLARKPRYLDLFIRHRECIAESGDPTVARLIYEDWRDRLEHKSNIVLDDAAFQNLLRQLAETYLAGQRAIRDRDLADMLPFANLDIVEELRTGGILRQHHGRYEVQENQLILAFGLLLVDQVEDAVRDHRDVYETIAEWLEPHPEMDIKARICEAAVLRALQNYELPTSAKTALLFAWLINQNIGKYGLAHFDAYFPLDRQSYFALAELIWSDSIDHAWGQRALMQTFLRWIVTEQETQVFAWQQQCERWLGFVHRSYYPYLGQKTTEEAQRIEAATNERLGAELQLGAFSFARYQFTITDDDGLIRLGRTALAFISHISREPYIRAIAIGCVAEAKMAHAGKYDEFAWVIRTAQQSLWPRIKKEIEHLLATNNTIAQQAAYRLLSFVGSDEAFQLRNMLPNHLFPRSDMMKRHLDDPCTSGFSWRREDCERCVSRIDLEIDWVARQIKPYCIDPRLPVPQGIGIRLAPLGATIDVQDMFTERVMTAGEHHYDNYEPSLCAYAPEIIADVVKRLIRDITVREGVSLRQMSLILYKHSLLFGHNEQEAIVQAWQQLVQQAQLTNDEAIAESFLFPEVLKQLEAPAQLTYLLERPEQAHDRIAFEQYFQPISTWQDVWQNLIAPNNVKTITRLLWFIAKQAATIPPEDVDTYVLPLINHDQSFVRAMAFRVIFGCTSEHSINVVLNGSWSWSSLYHNEENQWASLILADRGAQLPISNVVRRIHPIYVGYAINQRGNKPEEITAYAELLHYYWRNISGDTPEVPTDLPSIYLEDSVNGLNITNVDRRRLADEQSAQSPRFTAMGGSWGGDVGVNASDLQRMMSDTFEQDQQERVTRSDAIIQQQITAGNYWFTRRFLVDALAQVIQAQPDLVTQWVTSVLAKNSDAFQRIQAGGTFYEGLCRVLLQVHPQQGLDLYWYLSAAPMRITTLERNTHIRLLDYALFQAASTMDVQQAWQQRLEQAVTDQELLEFVITAHADQAQAWLLSYIDHLLQSQIPIDYMRALTLLGFIDSETCGEQLTALQSQVSDTWIRELIDTSLHRWRRNTWAKHWFQQFLSAENDQYAWAAFRLFLRCVDRRFWLWHMDLITQVGRDAIARNRLDLFMFNEQDIEKSAKKNEEDLRKHFLGQEVMKGELWPWMKN